MALNTESWRSWRPPAITTGVIPFILLLRVFVPFQALELTRNALFQIDLNRLSFYPLVFFSWVHLVTDLMVFIPLLSAFELSNGTVRTGIVMNITAFLPGVISNLIARFGPAILSVDEYCGTMTWSLAIAAALSVTRYPSFSTQIRGFTVNFPAWLGPLVVALPAMLFTSAGPVLTALALGMGYGLGTGALGFLVEGTTTPVAWIEEKLEPGIRGLRHIVRFVGEIEARDIRRMPGTATRITAEEIALPSGNLTHAEP